MCVRLPVPQWLAWFQVKFTPKVPARRKAAQAEAASNAPSSSDAVENEAFKDLIKAVQTNYLTLLKVNTCTVQSSEGIEQRCV